MVDETGGNSRSVPPVSSLWLSGGEHCMNFLRLRLLTTNTLNCSMLQAPTYPTKKLASPGARDDDFKMTG